MNLISSNNSAQQDLVVQNNLKPS